MIAEEILRLFHSNLHESAESTIALEQLRIAFLGKNGHVTALMKQLGSMALAERAAFGAKVNELRGTIEQALAEAILAAKRKELEAKLEKERIDVTLPARTPAIGGLHPISEAIKAIQEIFGHMGFTAESGPEIEDDWHNFTALNIGHMHPARQMHDTFYCTVGDAAADNLAPHPQHLLRTHTSTVQIRHMSKQQPPIKIIAAGRVYRADYDATHTPMFHQVEGLYVDHKVSMAQLKGCIETFLELFFGTTVEVRLRPSYFPFTEPSAEVDIRCDRSKPGQIIIGSGEDWLEVMGCGLVHPNVLHNVGIDPASYQGFAFGMGVERMAMLKYGIADLRYMYDGDIRRRREA